MLGASLLSCDLKSSVYFCKRLSILWTWVLWGFNLMSTVVTLYFSFHSQKQLSLREKSIQLYQVFHSLPKYHCCSWRRNKYINNFVNDNSFHPHEHIASRTKNGHESKSLMYNPSNRKSTSKSYFIHPRLICSCLHHYSQAPQVLVLGSMCW